MGQNGVLTKVTRFSLLLAEIKNSRKFVSLNAYLNKEEYAGRPDPPPILGVYGGSGLCCAQNANEQFGARDFLGQLTNNLTALERKNSPVS